MNEDNAVALLEAGAVEITPRAKDAEPDRKDAPPDPNDAQAKTRAAAAPYVRIEGAARQESVIAPPEPDEDETPPTKLAAPTEIDSLPDKQTPPEPHLAEPASDADARNGRSQKSVAAAALAAFFGAAGVAAIICAGLFVADAISRLGGAILHSGFAAAPVKDAEALSTAIEADGETTFVKPSEAPALGATATTADVKSGSAHAIEHLSMSPDDPFAVSNMTSYDPNIAALTSVEAFAASAPAASDGPRVLVVHTHATEAYAAEGEKTYSDDASFRSQDTAQNVVAVGDELCASLEEAGIETLHCTRLFDAEDFERAYELCAAEVSETLAANPSITLVLDIHRDAIFRPDNTLLAPTTNDGAAQVMIVCGTDELGADFPDWRDNLAFAFSVQAAAGERYPDLMRGVNLRGASFNEQLAERYLLVEVGSAGNTLAEAKAGARRFAKVLSEVLGD